MEISNTPKIDKIEKTLANKSRKYWAEMRSTMGLLHRSENIDILQIEAIKDQLTHILDIGIINYPTNLKQLGINENQTYQEKKDILGVTAQAVDMTKEEEIFLRNMANKANTMRQANWSWRIGQEAAEKHALGWHPFFVTLTVDPKRADSEKLWKEGRAFRKYIRDLADMVCKQLGHPLCRHKPYNPESDYVTYAGVIEHGKSRMHNHGHFIIWLRTIPTNWRVCPNRGIRNPANKVRNECLPLRTYWPHSLPGLSPALYFRSIGDIWEKVYNFALPLKDGRPMKVATPRIAGAYITKYLSKEHKEWNHRMKATRNLGMKRLKETIANLPIETVEALTWRPTTSDFSHSLSQIHTVPQGLMRSVAKTQLYLHKYRNRQLDIQSLMTSNCMIFTRMLSSVRCGARPDRMHSHQFYDWVSEHLPEPRGYCETRLLLAHKQLRPPFPPDKQRVQHVKIGANDIGHT